MTSECQSLSYVENLKNQIQQALESIKCLLEKTQKWIEKSKVQFDLWKIRRLVTALSVKSVKFGIFVSFRAILSALSKLAQHITLLIFKTATVVSVKVKAIFYQKYHSSSITLNNIDSMTSEISENSCLA